MEEQKTGRVLMPTVEKVLISMIVISRTLNILIAVMIRDFDGADEILVQVSSTDA